MRLIKLCLILTLLVSSASFGGVKEDEAQKQVVVNNENELDKFGFAPALFIVNYDEEVLKDSKDVKVRGDGVVSAKGSEYSVSMGLELHYDFSFGHTTSCYSSCDDSSNWNVTSSHRISPFLGLFDVENGINGLAAGLIYGYTKGDGKNENKSTLNFGVGWAVHKDRLVLAQGVREGAAPPAGLNVEDYTERKDVEGVVVMVSVNIGFGK